MADPSCTLEWSLAAGSEAVAIDYRLVNGPSEPLWVLDRMVEFGEREGFVSAPRAVIVEEDREAPGRLLLTRGYVAPPWSDVAWEIVPGARRAEPGQTLEGSAVIPLPLAGWHPNEGFWDLAGPPVEAVLEVGVLPVRCRLEPLALSDGTAVDVPHPADLFEFQRRVRGAVLALPPVALRRSAR